MQLAKHRYTKKGFPEYRYIPTVNPHPGIHPKGHSYGKPEEKLEYLPPDQWMKNESYLYGVDLFNHGYWWEAHEAWENVWMTTKKFDLEGRFLQGLIQFSAALLKLYSKNMSGFTNLYGEAEKKINFCLSELASQHRRSFMGIPITEWMSRMEIFKQSLPKEIQDNFDPLHLPNFPALILDTKTKHL